MTKTIRKTPDDLQQMAEIMRALAHNERLAIARLLFYHSNDGLAVKTIYEKLNLAQPVVSKHLAIMKNVGVVRRKRRGQHCYYSLCKDNRNIENLSTCFSK